MKDITSKIDSYLLNKNDCDTQKPLVIVCPGGGYTHHSDREAVPVAQKFNSLGFHSVVLYYDLAPNKFPSGLLDLYKTIKYFRQNALDFSIDANRIIVCGFSAGGHLCASSGCFWNSQLIINKMNCSPELYKPNMLILCYSVITAGEYAHKGSFCNLIGGNEQTYNISDYDNVSLEKQVTKDVPPSFIWHTVADDFVPAENSMFFARELKKNAIPFELHLFAEGQHGISLATSQTSREGGVDIVPECQIWPELFVNFYKTFYKEI